MGYVAFPFESGNGRLLKLVAGTCGVVTLCQEYVTVQSIRNYMLLHSSEIQRLI